MRLGRPGFITIGPLRSRATGRFAAVGSRWTAIRRTFLGGVETAIFDDRGQPLRPAWAVIVDYHVEEPGRMNPPEGPVFPDRFPPEP